MAVRPIVQHALNPEVLRKQSVPVRAGASEVRELIEDLKDTLLCHANGVGLAAPQIGVHQRAIVVRLGAGQGQEPAPPIGIINPEIVEAGHDLPDFDGCLSIPGLYGETVRPHFMRLRGLDEHGNCFEWTFEDFDAVVAHHEVDHLNGVLFIDRVPSPDKLYTEAEARQVYR